MEKDRTGEYVVELFKDGLFHARRSLSCGATTFKAAVKAWERKGFVVRILRQPGLD